jgi:hypothetical protein
MIRVGRLSSAMDLISDYKQWAYVCDSWLFLAMAEWNVGGGWVRVYGVRV